MSKSLVSGLPSLRRRLEGLQAHLARDVLPRELKAGAAIFADQVRENMPVDSGELKDSVAVVVASPLHVDVEATGGHAPEDIIGVIEYGALGRTPLAPIRRAFAAKVRQVRSSIASGVARGVRKFGR